MKIRNLLRMIKMEFKPGVDVGVILPAWQATVEKCGAKRELKAILSVGAGGRAEIVLRFEEVESVVHVAGTIRGKGLKDPERAKAWADQEIRAWLTDRANWGLVESVNQTPENVPVDGFELSTIHDIYYMMLLLCA